MYTEEQIIEFAESEKLTAEQFQDLLDQVGHLITRPEPAAEAPVVPKDEVIAPPPLPIVPPQRLEPPVVQKEDSFFTTADEIQAMQGERLPPVEEKVPPQPEGIIQKPVIPVPEQVPQITKDQIEKPPMDLGDFLKGDDPSPYGFQGQLHDKLGMMGREEITKPEPPSEGYKATPWNRFTGATGIGLNKAVLGIGGLLDSEMLQGYARKRIQELRDTFPQEIVKNMDADLWVPDKDPDSWTGWKVNPEADFWNGLYTKTVEQVPHFALTIGTGAGLAKVGTNLLTKAVDKLPIKLVQKLFKPLWGKDKGKFTLEGADKAITGIGGAAGFGIAEGLLSGGFSRAEVGHAIRHAPEEMLNQSPLYLQLLEENGYRTEVARELLADQLSARALRGTAITTAILGAPMGIYFGKMIKYKANGLTRRFFAGGLGEAGQEIPQEFMEFIITETAKGDAGLPVEEIEKGIARALEAGTIAGPLGSMASTILGAEGTDEDKWAKLDQILRDIDIETNAMDDPAAGTMQRKVKMGGPPETMIVDGKVVEIEIEKQYKKPEEPEGPTPTPIPEEPTPPEEPKEPTPEVEIDPRTNLPAGPESERELERLRRVTESAERKERIWKAKKQREKEAREKEEDDKQKRIDTLKRKEEEEKERKRKEDPEAIAEGIKQAIQPGKPVDTEAVRKIIKEAPTPELKKEAEQEVEKASIAQAKATLKSKREKLAALKQKKLKPKSDIDQTVSVAEPVVKPKRPPKLTSEESIREAIDKDLKFNEEKLKETKQKPEFKKFIKDSKVVSDKGEPIVVYHGTQSDENFKEFIPKGSFGGWNHFGNWFSSKPFMASYYAATVEGSGPVYPAYLSIKNPWETTWDEMTSKFESLLGIEGKGLGSIGTRGEEAQNAIKKIKEHLKSLGHDGIIIRNFTGDSKWMREVGKTKADRTIEPMAQDIYITLESNQIRSPFAKFKDITGPDIMGDAVLADDMTAEEEITEDDEIAALEAEIREETYKELLDNYKKQPEAQMRTSTSIRDQAYSTPLPIGFLAGELAGVADASSVFEPTAGHGALVIGADPDTVTANEINPDRRKTLEESGFKVTNKDASKELAVPEKSQDSVVMNPPFGKLDAPEQFDGYKIEKRDHLIALKNLMAMKDSGRATIILGANLQQNKKLTDADRVFLNYLYGNYNVVDHFEIAGKLYNRMGASFPIRLITIAGRRKSNTVAPTQLIDRVETYDDLYGRFTQAYARSKRLHTAATGRGDAPSPSGTGIQSTAKPTGVPPVTGVGGVGTGEAGGGITEPVSGVGGEPTPTGKPPTGVGAGEAGGGIDAETGVVGEGKGAEVSGEGAEPTGETTGEGVSGEGAVPVGTAGVGAVAKVDPEDLLTPYEQIKVEGSSTNKNPESGILVPSNMVEGSKKSLEKLVKEVGPLDDYLMKELGYDSKDDMFSKLFGVQIDGIALAIYQLKKGSGFVIADQTGLGKGRQAAALLRWAKRNGKVPIFITANANLFTPLYQDGIDIGETFNPFILNNADPRSRIIGPNKEVIHGKITDKKFNENIAEIGKGKLPKGKTEIFATYSQFASTAFRQKRDAFLEIAPNALFVLDEMHNAAGEDSNTNRFFMELIKRGRGNGTVYLSATFAKRATNLPILFTTDLGKATDGNLDALVDLAQEGGLPLQRLVSAALAETGQMVRRQSSYKGIDVLIKSPDTNTPEGKAQERIETKRSDEVTDVIRDINRFNRLMIRDIRNLEAEMLKREGASLVVNGVEVQAFNLSSINFSSIFHNIVSQFLLSTKVDSLVEDVIAVHKKGEKTLISTQNTMGAFLDHFVEDNNLVTGSELIDFNWNAVLKANLEKTLVITKKPADGGPKIKFQMPMEAISPANKAFLEKTRQKIQALKLGEFPVSPYDMVRQRLEEAGIKTSEITGRENIVDYSTTVPTLQIRPKEEYNRAAVVQEYQDGDIDSIILNQAGSQGVSLHAKKGINDLRRRNLFVWQPNADINVMIQIMGRPNRVGQVNLPRIIILSSTLPTEKRPTAILAGKLEKLNANTTANSKSALSFDATNVFNGIGDEIIAGWLEANPQVAAMANIRRVTPHEGDPGKLARQVTGKIAIMPVEVQTLFWEEVGQTYHMEIETLNAAGKNPLDTQFHDYRAILKGEKITVVEETDKTSYFGSSAAVGLYDTKKDYKFTKPASVIKEVFESLGITVEGYNKGTESDTEAKEKWITDIKNMADKRRKSIMDQLGEDYKIAEAAEDKAAMASLLARQENIKGQHNDFIREIQRFIPGTAYVLDLEGEEMTGVVRRVKIPAMEENREGANPFALGQNTVSFVRNKGFQPISLAMSKLRMDLDLTQQPRSRGDKPIIVELDGRSYDEIFVKGEQGDQRVNRHIITGNLIKGLMATTLNGKIIDFSDSDGNRMQGILLPKGFDPKQDLRAEKKMSTPADIIEYLKGARAGERYVGYLHIKEGLTEELLITLKEYSNDLRISVLGQKKGAKWHQDPEILAVTGDFAGKKGAKGRMAATISEHKIERALAVILKRGPLYGIDYRLFSQTFKEETARDRVHIRETKDRLSEEAAQKYTKVLGHSKDQKRYGPWPADDPARGAGWISGGLPYKYDPNSPKYEPEKLQITLRRVLDKVFKARGARPDLIRDLVRRGLGVPYTSLPIHSSTAAGLFYTVKGSIRAKNLNRIGTLAHELGHWIRHYHPVLINTFLEHNEEIMELSPAVYRNKTVRVQEEEGFAEFIRLYLTKRLMAKRFAPDLYETFQEHIRKHPVVHAVFEEMTYMIHEWQGLTEEERMAAKFGKPTFMDKLKNTTIRGMTGLLYSTENEFITYWFNSRWPLGLLTVELEELIKNSGGLEKPLRPSDNPYLLEQLRKGLGRQLENAFLYRFTPFRFEDRLDSTKYGISLKEALTPVLELYDDKMTANWGYWMAAKRAKELYDEVKTKGVGRERSFSQDEFEGMLRKFDTYPEEVKEAFEKSSKLIKQYLDFVVDYAVDAGYLDPRVADAMKSYMAYIPFYRVQEKEGGKSKRKWPHRLKGGESNIIDVVENIMTNTANMLHAVNTNFVLIKTLEMSERLDVTQSAQVIEQIGQPVMPVEIATKTILEKLQKEHPEFTFPTSLAEEMSPFQTFFVPSGKDKNEEQVIVAKRLDPKTGRVKTIGIKYHDTPLGNLLYTSALSMRPDEMSGLERMFFYGARMARAGIVIMPDFMARNISRDTFTAFINSDKGKKFFPILSTSLGAFRIITSKLTNTQKKKEQLRNLLGDAMVDKMELMSQAVRIAEDFGGAYASQWLGSRVDKPHLEKHTVEELSSLSMFSVITDPKGAVKGGYNSLKRFKKLDPIEKLEQITRGVFMKPIELLETAGDVSEGATRSEAAHITWMAEKATEEERRNEPKAWVTEKDVDAAVMAAVNFREWSVDFGTRGAGVWARRITQSVMFLNPRMQDLVKLFEKAGVKPAPGKLAKVSWTLTWTTFVRLSMFAGASVLLTLKNEDEDWYKTKTDQEKNTKIFLTEKYNIMSPFSWGTISYRIPAIMTELSMDWIRDKYELTASHMRQFKEALSKAIWDMVGGTPYPQAFLGYYEISRDRHLYFDRPLEGERNKKRIPALRVRKDTPLFLKEYGKANPLMPLSPIYIDHLLKTHFTGFYKSLAALSDMWTRTVLDLPPKAQKHWTEFPIVSSFVNNDKEKTYDRNTIELMNRLRAMTEVSTSYFELEELLYDAPDDKAAAKIQKSMDILKEEHPLADSTVHTDKIAGRAKKSLRELRKELREIDAKPRSDYKKGLTGKQISALKRTEKNELAAEYKEESKEFLDDIKEEYDIESKEMQNRKKGVKIPEGERPLHPFDMITPEDEKKYNPWKNLKKNLKTGELGNVTH